MMLLKGLLHINKNTGLFHAATTTDTAVYLLKGIWIYIWMVVFVSIEYTGP